MPVKIVKLEDLKTDETYQCPLDEARVEEIKTSMSRNELAQEILDRKSVV